MRQEGCWLRTGGDHLVLCAAGPRSMWLDFNFVLVLFRVSGQCASGPCLYHICSHDDRVVCSMENGKPVGYHANVLESVGRGAQETLLKLLRLLYVTLCFVPPGVLNTLFYRWRYSWLQNVAAVAGLCLVVLSFNI